MNVLSPLEVLCEMAGGTDVPLPPELAALYGPLRLPLRPGLPAIVGNLVSTLDGVVSLHVPGMSGGRPISGDNPYDRMTMGLLRAVADAVVVGAGTLRDVPQHRWTAAHAAPALADAYQSLRTSLGKTGPPLNVFVTAHGDLDLGLPVFQSGEVPVLLVTRPEGASRLAEHELPRSTQIATVAGSGRLSARSILAAVHQARPGEVILIEGGPQLMGDFLAEGCLDELYLTLAPQIAGRDGTVERPGLVAGRRFAPEHPLWGTLVSVRRAASHLFLRYAFAPPA
jgi:riboflavin biosynthesis pyrimidine reductase